MPKPSNYEARRHVTEEIPYSFYECKIPENFVNVPLHWHREYELNYIIAGSGVFRINDTEYKVKTGDIIFIQPEKLHAVYPDSSNFQVYNTLVFSPQILNNDYGRAGIELIRPIEQGRLEIAPHITSNAKGYNKLRPCVESIFANIGVSPLGDIMLKAKLTELLYLLVACGYTKTGKSIELQCSLKPILKYINDNYSANITVKDLAGIAHLSESYFMAQFKRQTGVSAIEYINQLRIKRACTLLRESLQSVTEIALSCGFKNISNFNRCFKKVTGTTPLCYRKGV